MFTLFYWKSPRGTTACPCSQFSALFAFNYPSYMTEPVACCSVLALTCVVAAATAAASAAVAYLTVLYNRFFFSIHSHFSCIIICFIAKIKIKPIQLLLALSDPYIYIYTYMTGVCQCVFLPRVSALLSKCILFC